MSHQIIVNANEIREEFSAAMSSMYRREVPTYGTLIDLVKGVNAVKLTKNKKLNDQLAATDGLERISEERHGAIRLSSAQELSMMRRIFAVMGMYPVDYYDLSVSGIPVHSTAFRPVSKQALAHNPFRIFTSLLRLDLIADQKLRNDAEKIIAKRRIFTPMAIKLVEKAEHDGHLDEHDTSLFITEVTETFRWHAKAQVSLELYQRLHDAHRLIADIISFKGPHINHLTPRTLDIDTVQALMPERDITPKAVIEGPPPRECPILLRQTSFKALEEQVEFTEQQNKKTTGTHTARFGEIEQRGAALTPKGHELYNNLLTKTRAQITPSADGSNATAYNQKLAETFKAFPDSWDALRQQDLAYFSYSLTSIGKNTKNIADMPMDSLIEQGFIQFDPIVYEDFLPVSAAGIFQSNLGDDATQAINTSSNQPMFEQDLGTKVMDSFAHYADIQAASIANCIDKLKGNQK